MANNSTTAISPAAGANNTATIFEGWKPSDTDRGSIDIIWACIVTIVLCCWVSTHPNVPSLNDKRYLRFVDKFNLACIGLLGADFFVVFAMGQFANARRSVKLFADEPELRNGREWTIGFPVTSEQLFYLVKYGHMEFPSLTREEIKDMSHVDTLSQVIVVWQVTWFIVTETQRLIEGLPMTTLELTALSFSVMMIITSAVWYHKPTIARPVTISTKNDRTVEEIRSLARNTTHPGLPQQWYRTPLYFISGPRYRSDVVWSWYKELTYMAHFPIFGRQMKTGLWDRIPDDLWLPVSDKYLYLLGGLFQTAFSLAFLAAWNFHFPSNTEKAFWRFSASFHFSISFFGAIYILCNELDHKRKCRRRTIPDEVEQGDVARLLHNEDIELRSAKAELATRPRSARLHRLWNRFSQYLNSWRNISSSQDPELSVGLKTSGPLTVLAITYLTCRLFVYIEDIISMRSQPQGVYTTVSRFIVL
ncbi:hypothetical protein BR93DRAFT_951775 [Coniochaeta sp. PMI_546]|nr:hypothetical protein BR93DRAFT_951775 [Coniochaeta sp. PMI_546]